MRHIVLPLLMVSLFGVAGNAEACCAVSSKGVPAVNADQTVILLWDRANQTEHFIRRANFRSRGDSVGFLVPTPSRPQLEESGDVAFAYLDNLTAPPPPASAGLPTGCSSPKSSYAGRVQVIEEKTVAGYQTVVLAADSGKALVAWLKDHDYDYTPEAEAWAEPYLQNRWYMTAMKIAKKDRARKDPSVAASALRISFKTDRPLFPYREPDSRRDAAKLGISDRVLRIFFVGEQRYEGRFPSGQTWSQPSWSQPLTVEQRSELLRDLALPESTGPKKFWLTECREMWPYGKAPGDIYFYPSASQEKVGFDVAMGVDPTLVLALGVVLARPLFRRRKVAEPAEG